MISEEAARQKASIKATPATGINCVKHWNSSLMVFIVFCLILSISFWRPLFDLVRFAVHSDMYSHILLIPFISLYLVFIKRKSLPSNSQRSFRSAIMCFVISFLSLFVGYLLATYRGICFTTDDYLFITILAFVFGLGGGCFWILGKELSRTMMFPLAFLAFMIPFPTFFVDWLELFFQHTSAEITAIFLWATGTPALRNGLVFNLPGISIQVAKECSGIHSSLVLFITSLLAGHLFFNTRVRRVVLTLFVIPLSIVRNAIRIATISLLCVYINPNYIHSYIHHQGGPIFFLLALVPFFILLVWMKKSENRLLNKRTKSQTFNNLDQTFG